MATRLCITICHTVSLTFAGCLLQLYLLRMFCFSAHRKVSFRTWFFQMFFNKSLIMCEKFVSCLTQYSKQFWKWLETYVLILHSYWTPQFYMAIITLYNSKIVLSLHCFLTPQFQTFINLLIGIFRVSNPTFFLFFFFFFWDFWETMCQLQLILLVIILCYNVICFQ